MLDKIDCSILELLQHDAKLTNKEIADKLGKTTTPIFERIKKLENENVIIKYMAIVNREKVGKHLVAFTNVQLKEHSQSMILAFEKNIVLLPEVMEAYHMTGLYDYLLKIIVSDMKEYQEFIVNKLAKLSNIGTVQSSFIMTEVKSELGIKIKSKAK